jgi:hypothetical protein
MGLGGNDICLDERCLDTILSYVRYPSARGSCKSWASHIHDALQLEHNIRVNQLLEAKGSLTFDHTAVRELGPDFVESATYQFEFYANGEYALQWSRTFGGGWAAENERQVGKWRVEKGEFLCESVEGPKIVAENMLRYSWAGIKFQVPVDQVLSGRTSNDDAPLPWERAILSRGGEVTAPGEAAQTVVKSDAAAAPEVRNVPPPEEPDENSKFVEVDGELVEVSPDIRDNHPEADWARLMGFRLRFGID